MNIIDKFLESLYFVNINENHKKLIRTILNTLVDKKLDLSLIYFSAHATHFKLTKNININMNGYTIKDKPRIGVKIKIFEDEYSNIEFYDYNMQKNLIHLILNEIIQ